MDVTTTSTRIGKFDARFYHLVFEEECGRIKGHFGPINSVAFHPDGKGLATRVFLQQGCSKIFSLVNTVIPMTIRNSGGELPLKDVVVSNC